MLSDLVYGVVNCPADQFGARCACLPPQLVDLLDLLPGEMNLRFLHHAPSFFGYGFRQLDRGHRLVALWVQMPNIATRGFVD